MSIFAGSDQSSGRRFGLPWAVPLLLLGAAYGLWRFAPDWRCTDAEILRRSMFVDARLARIWSVGRIEIALAYAGVFLVLTRHIARAAVDGAAHRRDFIQGALYCGFTFLVNCFCVYRLPGNSAPFIGYVAVTVLTLGVSRQLWFGRLVGIFVPLVFFSCAVGYFLDGMASWERVSSLGVPWTMTIADVGFAILVNAARFPAFLQGHDISDELAEMRDEAAAKHQFLRDMLLRATQNRFCLCDTLDDLPRPLPLVEPSIALSRETLAHARRRAVEAGRDRRFSDERLDCVQTAAGEAAMNAIVHGDDGELTLRADRDTLQIWIVDRGDGVRLSQLPRSVLEEGYTAAGADGQGFSLMLNMADRLDLLTGRAGTTVVLTIHRQAPLASPSPLPNAREFAY